MARVVDAFQAMRGVGFVAAVIFVAELGDFRRLTISPKDEKHTGRLRNRDHLRAFSACAGGCWRDDWSFPLISEKCRQLPQRGAPFLVHGYKAAV